MSKPALLKGTRDFGPKELLKRDFIFDTIRETFRLFGYAPLETPAMESMETLTGKYGEEGDRLLFKILNNGDFLDGIDRDTFHEISSNQLVTKIAKRGLRYDLTVPFARYVAMNQTHISFPFKRFQIQPVWRADRPQKGRYQEFYQCDADVVGSTSLWYEAELMAIYSDVFQKLNVPVVIKYNNRKILQAIAESAGIADRFQAMTIIIDKIDKIGIEGISLEMEKSEFPSTAIDFIINILNSKESIETLKQKLSSEVGQVGCDELSAVQKYLSNAILTKSKNVKVEFDVSLARGLGYYTGFICEVVAGGDIKMGSIGGGGRYDNLTGVFGLPNVSGVGISFGAERIYDVMEELDLWPASLKTTLNAVILTMDDEAFDIGTSLLNVLRNSGIKCDIYPSPVKMQKQMKYANDIAVPFAIIIGDEEKLSNSYSLKNMATGEQRTVNASELLASLTKA